MDREQAQELLRKMRNFCLGKDDGEWPEEDLIDLFNDPEFRKAYDEDEDIEDALITHWVESSKQRSLQFFEQFRDFCHGRKAAIPENRRSIKTMYKGNSVFRQACDNDPVVRAVLDRWFKEDQGSVSE